jgi:hypothetical protein
MGPHLVRSKTHSVRSKIQAQVAEPVREREKERVLGDPCLSEHDRAVLQTVVLQGDSDWLLALPVPHLQLTMSLDPSCCRLQSHQPTNPSSHIFSQCPYRVEEICGAISPFSVCLEGLWRSLEDIPASAMV